MPLPPTHWGGLHAFVANLNSGLRDAGWRWLIVVPPEALDVISRFRELRVDVMVAPLARFRRSFSLTAKSLINLPIDLRRIATSPDLSEIALVQAVGAHHPHGALLAAWLKKPLVWQVHSSILPRVVRKLVAPIISVCSDSVMTNGQQVTRDFWGRETLGPRHFVFYAPLDQDSFAPDAFARRESRERLNYLDEFIVVGTVGNRVWQKNHEFLVRAAESMAHLYPKLRFLILGEKSESYNSKYQKQVEIPAQRLNERFPGYVTLVSPGREVRSWIHSIDIFTLTSHAEGVPIALFEAMSAAKPVLTSNVGSILEVVDNAATGFLYSPGDLSAYCEKLELLIADIGARQTMGLAGRARLLSHFSLEKVLQAHTDAYRTALQSFEERHLVNNANIRAKT